MNLLWNWFLIVVGVFYFGWDLFRGGLVRVLRKVIMFVILVVERGGFLLGLLLKGGLVLMLFWLVVGRLLYLWMWLCVLCG